jgi:hypothetical protein
MAGIPGKGGVKGKSGPPGNQNAFRHGLAAIEKRQDAGLLAPVDESIRQQILDGLISDKGGDDQISTATRILAEVIASDATWLMVFNQAINRIVANNQKVRENPRGRWLQAWLGEQPYRQPPEIRPGPSPQDEDVGRPAPGR